MYYYHSETFNTIGSGTTTMTQGTFSSFSTAASAIGSPAGTPSLTIGSEDARVQADICRRSFYDTSFDSDIAGFNTLYTAHNTA
jgi:hypothetical protein